MFNKEYQNISKLFAKWGKEQMMMPGQAEEIKNKVLEIQDRNKNAASLKRPFAWLRLSFALAGLLLVVVFTPRFFRDHQTASFLSRTDFDTDYSQNVSILKDNIVGESGGEEAKSVSENKKDNHAGEYPADDLGLAYNSYKHGVSAEDLGLSYGAETGFGDNNFSIVKKLSQMLEKRSVEDTREFMQTDYSAHLRLREVEEPTHDIELLVRGLGGRIDRSDISKEYANVSFVLPKESLLDLTEEIYKITSARFIDINESNINLLSEKQTVEQAVENNDENLLNLQAEKKDLIATHQDILAQFNKQKSDIINKISALSRIMSTDTAYMASIEKQINNLVGEKNSLIKQIDNENAVYNKKIKKLDDQISAAQKSAISLAEQDANILETVATVKGYLSFERISIWEVWNEYLNFKITIPILCVGLIIFGLVGRRQKGFDLP